MNTTGQPAGQDSTRRLRGWHGARADTLDVVLLILTILVLTGAAVGIVIGFPQALEIVAVQANAAVTGAGEAQAPQPPEQVTDENERENAPFFADDIGSASAVYAAARGGMAALSARQAPAAG